MPVRILVILTALAALPTVAAADPPIADFDGADVTKAAFEKSSSRKPLVLRTADEAQPYFAEATWKTLSDKIDFEKQFVLLFAWKGSGQDKLTYVVAESFPEQIFFQYAPGRTRDLRPHVHVYILRSNVKWNVK